MSDAPFLRDDLPDDPDAALAAEYVLRLLDPAEEAACAARIERDPAFAAEVARWQDDLSALDGEFGTAAPPPGLARRVEERLFGRQPGLLARLWSSAGLWRAVAAAAVVAAVVFGRPAPEVGAPELVATVAPTVGDVQLVALLDRDAGLIRFTRLAGEAPPGRSLELWLLPEGATAPASLGVVPSEARFAVAIPTGLAPQVGPGTAILVSSEQAGGSPTGQPQGDVLAQGAVSEL
jgi:anti-sigma-K factor RskA